MLSNIQVEIFFDLCYHFGLSLYICIRIDDFVLDVFSLLIYNFQYLVLKVDNFFYIYYKLVQINRLLIPSYMFLYNNDICY